MSYVNDKRLFGFILIAIVVSTVFCLSTFGYCSSVDVKCYEGDGVTDQMSRKLQPFDKVMVSGAYTIKITCGETPQCLLRGDRNLLDRILTQVENGQLIVRNGDSLRMKQPLEIELQLPKLVEFYAEGSHEILIESLDEDIFSLILDGANLANVTGNVNMLSLQLNGSSVVDCKNLRSTSVNATASGTTSAQIHVDHSLTVNATGLSEVIYSGKPTSVDVELSGLAEITTAE